MTPTNRWVRDTALDRWRDSFFLTGMKLGNETTVWRLSFEHAPTKIAASSKGVNVFGVSLELKNHTIAACDLHFHQATMLDVSAIAPAGVWIVQHGEGLRTNSAVSKVEVACGSTFAAEWPLQD